MGEELCGQLQAVVLMGGLGSRLGEITEKCPKAMLDINGRPFFQYQFELLLQAGFRRFVFCLGYRAEAVREWFGDGSRWDVEIRYSYDGDRLLGTGGAVRRALPLLEEDFLLLYGDSFMDIDYFEVVVRYRQAVQAGKRALMTVMENGDRFDKSNVICVDGELVLYDKQHPDPRMSYIDYGVSVFRRDVFAAHDPDEAWDLSDIQHDLSAAGLLAGCEVEHRFYEIGTPASLEEFRAYAKQRWDSLNRAVFLDRDGVINEICWNEDTEQLDSPLNRAHFQLLPGVTQALRTLQEAGYLLFVVTNQPAAAKGKTTFAELCAINHSLVRQMQREGVEIVEVAMCPHYGARTAQTREEYLIRDCNCRKPKTGLIDRLQEKYAIDMENSWMVGDSATDILCGKSAGLYTAFLGKFKCDLCMMIGNQKPDMVCENLLSFARHIQDETDIKKRKKKMKKSEYIASYLEQTKKIADTVPQKEIEKAIEILQQVRANGGRLFILGVGGSAANASHAVNDFRKIGGIETYAPTDNVSELTARTNDEGWNTTFVEWLRTSHLSGKDAIMVFSVGGGSEMTSLNIVNALKLAQEHSTKIIGIVSRSGGYTKAAADACVLVPVVDESRITPHAEGWQGVVWHLMVNALDSCE